MEINVDLFLNLNVLLSKYELLLTIIDQCIRRNLVRN